MGLSNLIFPKNIYCICCGDSIDSNRLDSLCLSCRKKITFISDNPYLNQMDSFSFDELLACCIWGYYPRKIISSFKEKDSYLYDPIGQIMAEKLILSEIDVDALVYVPSDRNKEKKIRGYNPAKLLAKKVSKVTGLPIYHILKKTSITQSNRLSSKQEREHNPFGAFLIDEKDNKKIQGKTLVLVDDILTTGSTADEVSRVLKSHGAKKVIVLCFSCSSASPLYQR